MPRLRAVLTADEHLQVFVLESLFSPHTSVLNHTPGTLLYLTMQPGVSHPVLLPEEQFAPQEMSLLLPRLPDFPEYAPMEELYASFCYGFDGLTEQRIEQVREHLNELDEEHIWDHEVRGLCNVMSRLRVKLRHLGLDTVSLLETGYQLIGNTRRRVSALGEQGKEKQR